MAVKQKKTPRERGLFFCCQVEDDSGNRIRW